jgi:hypothetical protein
VDIDKYIKLAQNLGKPKSASGVSGTSPEATERFGHYVG